MTIIIDNPKKERELNSLVPKSITRKYKELVGDAGEKVVSDVLSLLSDEWFLFNNIHLKSRQIDHILLSAESLFVIETKNFTGDIYGNSERRDWKRYINDNDETETLIFYNPVAQVLKSSVAIKNFLLKRGIYYKITPLVVFSNQNSIVKVKSPEIKVLHIAQFKEYVDTLKQQKPRSDENNFKKTIELLKNLN